MNAPLFEVFDRFGVGKMQTNSESCIYPLDTLRKMAKAGYTFRRNGKPWKPGRTSIKTD